MKGSKQGMDSSARLEVLKAITRLNGEVAPSDIVVLTGLPLLSVIRCLNSIAYESAAHLKVSSDGRIVYIFPKHLFLRRSLGKIALIGGKIRRILLALLLFLFKSIIAATLLVSLLLYYSLAFLLLQIFSVFTNMEIRSREMRDEFFALLLQMVKAPVQNGETDSRERAPGIIDACFAFLFGPVDPNSYWHKEQWCRLSSLITACGGVILPEQARLWSTKEGTDDFDLEVLQRFDGIPLATETGNILFYFPHLVDSRPEAFADGKEQEPYLKEELWRFSELSKRDLIKVLALCLVNLLACNSAFFVLHELPALFNQALVYKLILFFWFYGNTFLLLPLSRLLLCFWRNHKITIANCLRKIQYESLKYPCRKTLQQIQEAEQLARAYAEESRRQAIIFDTEEDSLAQFISMGGALS